MPADRPSRRPGPAPDGPSYWSDGGSAQDRTRGRGPGGGPHLRPPEGFHLSDGERSQSRSEVGKPRGQSAPTRVERVYPQGGGAGNRRSRHALTRAERLSFEGGQAPGRRPGGWDSESEESDDVSQ